ncbi:ABC1 family-domain-containing protein [Limtongia smithiae]|uniref:ABC1 family-domain-containing protein n=1 Tax=Limtongia smithiae TaxID=1125753 RepID=UPI0034CF320E
MFILSSAAPVKCENEFPSLAEVDSHPSKFETREQFLLAMSAADNESYDDDGDSRPRRRRQRRSRLRIPRSNETSNFALRWIYLLVEDVYESFATCVRFVHLALIFVPVASTLPAVFFGSRLPPTDPSDTSYETTGALWWYHLLVWSMEAAGPTFIKLGQWAASRTDIFPHRMCVEMSKLHSNVKAHPLVYTIDAIEDAFHGMKFADIFDEFETKPLGIGAIAQVYKAKLSAKVLDMIPAANDHGEDKAWVAVKVLHPKVEPKVHRDLHIMHFFASVLDCVPTIEWLSLPQEVEQFGNMMRLQMDLRIESTNLAIFQRNFAGRRTGEGIHFPVSYSAILPRMDSKRVLIEEYVEALPMGQLLSLPPQGRVQMETEIADMGLNAFLNMLLIDNFVHADLHPGNIMVRFIKPNKHGHHKHARHKHVHPSTEDSASSALSRFWSSRAISFDLDATNSITERLAKITSPAAFRAELSALDEAGFRPQVVFLDAGLVTELNAVNRRNFIDLFASLATFDGYRAGELMVERSRTPASVVDADVFALKMQRLLLSVKSKTFALGNIKIADVLNSVLSMVRRHHVRMEGDFVNVVLSVMLLEGIGRQLDPNLDIFRSSLPILRRLGAMNSMNSPQNILHDESTSSMLKVWVALEAREFVTASAQDINRLIRYDRLCPNI